MVIYALPNMCKLVVIYALPNAGFKKDILKLVVA